MASMTNNQSASELEQTYVHSIYASIAPFFDHSRNAPWPRVLEFLGQFPCGSLIGDVGCGNGKYSDVTWNNTFMCGSDICQELLQIANRKGTHQGVVVADNNALPFVSNRFDGIISIGVIHHLSTEKRRIKAIRECARLLKPGGKLLINVWALEQSQRSFSAQDVLVPWKKQLSLRHSSAISTGSVDSVDGLPSSMHEHGEPMDCGNAAENSQRAKDPNKEFYKHFCKELSLDKPQANHCDRNHPPSASPSILRRFQSWWKSSPPPEGLSTEAESEMGNSEDQALSECESSPVEKEATKSSDSSTPVKSPEACHIPPPVPTLIADVTLPPTPNPMLQRKPTRRLSLFTQKITLYSPRVKRRISLWLNTTPLEDQMKLFAGKLVDDCYRSVMVVLASIFAKTIASPDSLDVVNSNDEDNLLDETFETPDSGSRKICDFLAPISVGNTLNRNASDSAVSRMMPTQTRASPDVATTKKRSLGPRLHSIGDESVSLPCTPLLKHTNKPPFTESAKFAGGVKKMTWYRYYHVFKKGELERLISKVDELELTGSHYDHANWCAVAVKKQT